MDLNALHISRFEFVSYLLGTGLMTAGGALLVDHAIRMVWPRITAKRPPRPTYCRLAPEPGLFTKGCCRNIWKGCSSGLCNVHCKANGCACGVADA